MYVFHLLPGIAFVFGDRIVARIQNPHSACILLGEIEDRQINVYNIIYAYDTNALNSLWTLRGSKIHIIIFIYLLCRRM